LGGFGEGADLVDLEEKRVGGAGVDSALDSRGGGAEEVVAQDEERVLSAARRVLSAEC